MTRQFNQNEAATPGEHLGDNLPWRHDTKLTLFNRLTKKFESQPSYIPPTKSICYGVHLEYLLKRFRGNVLSYGMSARVRFFRNRGRRAGLGN